METTNYSSKTHALKTDGMRVVRGPSWNFGNQDAGEGHVGTIVDYKKLDNSRLISSGIVIVAWDCGVRGMYRIGHEGSFDLRIVDNSATDVKHPNISCIQCCSQSEITGIRWHCETCNGSLCSSCFFKETHDHEHVRFQRYQTPNTPPVSIVLDWVKPRIEMKGIFAGARVKRGHDWNNGTEDHNEDGVEGVGQVIETGYMYPTPGKINVKWSNGNTFSYRLGSEGKSDLKLVAPSTFGHYHPEYLPVLKSNLLKAVTSADGEIKFAVGDPVGINPEVDAKRFEEMQEGHGGWNNQMKDLIGKIGIVRGLAEHGISVQYGGHSWRINPEALVRLSPFSIGQPVQIKCDEDTIREITERYGNPTARDIAGETGKFHYYIEGGRGDIEIILDDSEKTTKKILLDRNWVTIIACNESLNKGMAKLKSKTVSFLVEAAALGHLHDVKTLLTKYPVEIDAKNDSGRTALQSACLNGRLKIVRWLIERKADFELQDDKERRAIHYAVKRCHPAILTLLIEKGAKLDVLDIKMLTPLQLAVKAGCLQSVSLLIKNGCNINLQDSDGDTALNNAIIQEQHSYRDPKIVDTLASSVAMDLKIRNNHGFNLLQLSIVVGNRRAFQHLLGLPNGTGTTGKELAAEEELNSGNKLSALHLICYKGDYKFAKIFLKHLKPKTEENPIEKENQTKICLKPYFTVADGRDLRELRCKGGMTPLMLATYRGHHDLIELLVEEGEVDIEATNEDGDTAVHIAALRLEILKGEPKEQSSPRIFQIHLKLMRESNLPADTVSNYPALSIMCYLIEKGCPWRRTSSRNINSIITNELFRGILNSYSPPLEPMDVDTELANKAIGSCLLALGPQEVTVPSIVEDCGHTISITPMDVDTELTNKAIGSCLLCPQEVTVPSIVEDCGHTISITCTQCFSRLHKCPQCRGNNKSYNDGTNGSYYWTNLSPSLTFPSSWDQTLLECQKKQDNNTVRSSPSRSQDETCSEGPQQKRPHLSTPEIIDEFFPDEMLNYFDSFQSDPYSSSYLQPQPPINISCQNETDLAAGPSYQNPYVAAAGPSNFPSTNAAEISSIHSNLIGDPSNHSNSLNTNSSHGATFSNEYCQTDPFNSGQNLATMYNNSPQSSSQLVTMDPALGGNHSSASNNVPIVVDQQQPFSNGANNVGQPNNSPVNGDRPSDVSPLNKEDLPRPQFSAGQIVNCTLERSKKGKIILVGSDGNRYSCKPNPLSKNERWQCTSNQPKKTDSDKKGNRCPGTIIKSNSDGLYRISNPKHSHSKDTPK